MKKSTTPYERKFREGMAMKKTRLVGIVIVAGLVVFGMVANSAAASILLNGSFESPAIPINSYQHGTPSSWGWNGSSTGLILNGRPYYSGVGYWPSPWDGQQYVDIGNVSTFSLFQVFTVTNGGAYQLEWYDNAFSGGLTSPYSVSVSDGSEVIATADFNAAHGNVWLDRALLLNLVPGNYELTFTAKGIAGGYDTLLDKVTLTTTVPGPATIFLLGPAIAIIACVRIRHEQRGQV
jgi:hypothetical protein